MIFFIYCWGYDTFFPFQFLEQGMEADFKIPFIRLRLGLGFKQFML
jgi:hypothetical protein